jgi:tetratricopeptide (TPR) repeat protein
LNPLRRFSTYLIALFLSLHMAWAQEASRPCDDFGKAGAEALANGDATTAIQKYSQASKLCPEEVQFRIALGRAWLLHGDATKARGMVKPYLSEKQPVAEAFQLAGNCLESEGKNYEALEMYRSGLKHFPKSGLLHAEMGILEAGRGRLLAALSHWEEGIALEPNYPSNYYFAAKALHALGDQAWAINYAEAYIVLVRREGKVREMSQLIWDAYLAARYFDYEEAFKWNFLQAGDSLVSTEKDKRYHARLSEAFSSELPDTSMRLSIGLLSSTRLFASSLLRSQERKGAVSPIFEWHHLVQAAGHWEAYNHFLLYDAAPEEFMAWYKESEAAFTEFEDWFYLHAFYERGKVVLLRDGAGKKLSKK